MNQVAVVIGGGQTLGAFLCRGLAEEGYRVAVVDIQSDKAANVAQEINADFGEGMAYGFGADATSEQSVLALSRGVDEIFGRVAGATGQATSRVAVWRYSARRRRS